MLSILKSHKEAFYTENGLKRKVKIMSLRKINPFEENMYVGHLKVIYIVYFSIIVNDDEDCSNN